MRRVRDVDRGGLAGIPSIDLAAHRRGRAGVRAGDLSASGVFLRRLGLEAHGVVGWTLHVQGQVVQVGRSTVDDLFAAVVHAVAARLDRSAVRVADEWMRGAIGCSVFWPADPWGVSVRVSFHPVDELPSFLQS